MTAPSTAALAARLRAAGSVFAEDEADVLRSSATSPSGLERMVARRVAGEPLEVVVGWAEFRGARVLVDPGVFVPRSRTAVLVDHGLDLIGPGAVVVDLCCGTGAVGMVLLHGVPGIELHAADVEPSAVACARRNVEPLGGRVHEGDLFDALPDDLCGRIDLLVVNAPYVPTDAIASMPSEARDHEPRTALDGGPDGIAFHRRIAAEAGTWLATDGHVLVETSPLQAAATSAAFERAGLTTRVVSAEAVDGTAVVAWPVVGS